MSDFYTRMQGTARKLIRKFGRPCVVAKTAISPTGYTMGESCFEKLYPCMGVFVYQGEFTSLGTLREFSDNKTDDSGYVFIIPDDIHTDISDCNTLIDDDFKNASVTLNFFYEDRNLLSYKYSGKDLPLFNLINGNRELEYDDATLAPFRNLQINYADGCLYANLDFSNPNTMEYAIESFKILKPASKILVWSGKLRR